MAGTFHELCSEDLQKDATMLVAITLKNILIDINTVSSRLTRRKKIRESGDRLTNSSEAS